MITYDTLRELAHALSKVTGYRYVAFCNSFDNKFITYVSHSEMVWRSSKMSPPGYWLYDSDCQILDLKNLSDLIDWSKCQFDCKEGEEMS